MAIVVKDRVKQTASNPGTGTITLGATATGFQAFSAIGNGNVTYFAIVDAASGDWEVNYGTYTSSGTTLTRNSPPLSSSNAGALVNFTGTVDVFCTYPSEKAIYEEVSGNVLIDGGPITVVGTGVTSYTTFSAALAELYANVDSFAQMYAQNLSDGSSASTDIVAYNDIGDGTNNFIDMGIASSNYTEVAYPIFTPGSGYLYNDGGELFIGSATDDVVFFAGGVDTADEALRIDKTTKDLSATGALGIGGGLTVTGAASFSSTVALSANPTTALQAATKQYVDNQVTAGIHIHEPVLVATTGNLTATYTGGGTNANIIQIANGTDITFFSVTPAVGDQFYIGSSSNGLIANTAYFVVNIVSGSTIQASLTFDGAIVTGLTNGSPTIPSVINSGVGAYLTNSGAQAALSIDGVALASTNRVLVRNQTTASQNGVYTVTTVGTGATNWVLTRATDADRVIPTDPLGLGTGDYFFVQSGTLGAGDSFVLTTEPNTMIIGYTALTYTQFSGGITYTGGTNIDVTGQVISVTGAIGATNGGTGTATVATGDLLYGSAANTWSKLGVGSAYKSLVVNAAGTLPEWNAVALNQSGAVSGALPTANGGTNLTTYTLGDTLYSSAANTLTKLSGNTTTTKKFLVQTGTGAASAAPTWDVVNGADVNGNISGSAGSVANALTLGTYLTGTSFNGSTAVTATVDATSANTASKVVARDSSGNFSAGTITATLSGSSTSATTATNLAGGANLQIPYQTGAGTTSFITAASGTNYVLNYTGSAFSWVAGTISGVALGSNLNALTLGTYLTGTSYNGSTTVTAAVDATSANTASKVVARDSSGNFSAGTITAALTGNATTATTLATARAIYGNNFDGSAALTQVIASTYGGTGNGFTKFSGPTTAERTFTLPDATATILTSNAAVTVGQGGTGLTAGTSGGIPYYSSTSAITSSALLTQYGVVYGGGAGAAPVATAAGTTGQVLQATTSGAPVWGTTYAGTVTSVGFTGGIITVATQTTTPAFTVAGTSGGIPYFSSASTWATSAALAANSLVIGGGAGVAPSTTTTATGALTFLGTPTSANLAALLTDETGSGANVFATSPTLVTPLLGTPTSGILSNCTVDGTDAVGFRNIPQNAQTGNYTLVLADSGKHIYHAVAAGAATYTIPANGTVAYPIGTALSFVNLSTTSISIAITTDTMYLGGTGTTGTRTLAQYGTATALKVTSTVWIITGSGLT